MAVPKRKTSKQRKNKRRSSVWKMDTSVIEFLKRVEIESIVYPIQSGDDVTIAEAVGFDRISETLYVFDFVREDEEKQNESDPSAN